jgi:predicted RNA methylase
MLRKNGLASKYDSPGIYCIKLNEKIVYIGKSRNMLWRVASHYVGIKRGSERKYRILAEAQRKGKTVGFDVLYYAKNKGKLAFLNEIGEKEGAFIREYRPILNTQIPKEEDWHKWDVEEVNAREVLKLLLDNE